MRTLFISLLLLLTAPVAAKPLQAGCGYSIPPYVIYQSNRGIAVDILTRALATQGYPVTFSFDSNSALTDIFNQGKLDITCVSNASTTPDAVFSAQPLMVMHNMAVSLTGSAVKLSNITDLSKFRVTGFSLATRLMPPEYAAAVSISPDYQEITEQIDQVRALFEHKTDVIIIDQTIFRYYLSRLRHAAPGDPQLQQAYRYHNLFEPSHYYAAFHSAAVRDAFDSGLQVLRDSGEYRKIMDGYDKMLADYLFR